MKRVLLSLFILATLSLTGCTQEPTPTSSGTQKTTTLSGNDVTALGIKFDTLFHIGNTINISNSDAAEVSANPYQK